MKKFLATLVLTFMCVLSYAQLPFVEYHPVIVDDSYSYPVMPDYYTGGLPYVSYKPVETPVVGTKYNAIVLYNSSTGHEATYRLPVIVNDGAVKKIIFNNNGGNVHVGVNHSGYRYYGGKLSYDKELEGYITTVKIVNSNGSWQIFTVFIQG